MCPGRGSRCAGTTRMGAIGSAAARRPSCTTRVGKSEWGNRRGIGDRRLLERHPLSAVILFACVGVGLGYILFIGDGVGPEGDARGGR